MQRKGMLFRAYVFEQVSCSCRSGKAFHYFFLCLCYSDYTTRKSGCHYLPQHIREKQIFLSYFVVLLIPILCSAWLTFTVFKCTINVWIVGSFAELMCALFVLGIRLIDNLNQRRYRHSWTTGNAYTLSERYQLAENIRSGKIMRRSITVASFGLFFGIISFEPLKKTFMHVTEELLERLYFKTVSPKTTSNMKTSSGKKMVFKVEEERDLYFCQLRDSWR
uniref:Uncharacterized protein n=1 Tax=Ditylenchus dipsaci TaxID=166011 RepID=A0A915E0P9_9BILA